MSRIGKKPIIIPTGTEVTISDEGISVKGPQGVLNRSISPKVSITVLDNQVQVSPSDTTLESRALWGTFAAHVQNMVRGVNEKFQKQLIVEGVGFRAEMQGTTLVMQLGFSHPVRFDVPEGLTVTVEKNNITITGIDKELVGQFAAVVRAKKKPEPYKGKGIRYTGETIIRKEGKKTA